MGTDFFNTYEKEEKQLKINEPSHIQEESAELTEEKDYSSVDSLYFKKDKKRDYSLYYLIIEDSSTTKKYLASIVKNNPINGIQIVPVCGINAQYMEEKAQEAISDEGLLDLEQDKIYLVSDLDHYRSDLITLQASDLSQSWHLIISNPCIEIWFYYHFKSLKPSISWESGSNERHNSGKVKNSIWKELKIEKNIDPTKMLQYTETAISNSKSNYRLDSSNSFIPGPLATQMHEMMEPLLAHIDFCLKQDKEDKIQAYKKYKQALSQQSNK